MNYRKSIIGSSLAFILATNCCWLPALIIALGGGSTLIGLSNGIENFSGVFIAIGIGLLGYGLYQFSRKSKNETTKDVVLLSTITCPECGFQKDEEMPSDSCTYFYECEACHRILKPIKGDCCVFCSYGTVPCPPIQKDENCC
nr:GDCCVxC domain-containing (seleno)protein [Portibacter lacus]